MTELETKLAEELRAVLASGCPHGHRLCDSALHSIHVRLAEYDAQKAAEPCMDHERDATDHCGRCGVELVPERRPKAPPACTCPYMLQDGAHYQQCAMSRLVPACSEESD